MKRSAAEAGLDDRHLKVLTDITRPPLFPDFLWHSTTSKYWNDPAATSATGDDPHPQASSESNTTGVTVIKRSAATIGVMNKQREMTARMQAGPHYVRPTAVIDVVRYSNRNNSNGGNIGGSNNSGGGGSNNTLNGKYINNNPAQPDAIVAASMGKTNRKLATDPRYFPAELLVLLLLPQKKKAAVVRKSATTAAAACAVVKLEELANKEGGAAVGGEASAVPPGDDDEDDVLLEAPPEEEEDGEDYTTNYYNTDDEDSGGDDGEPTF